MHPSILPTAVSLANWNFRNEPPAASSNQYENVVSHGADATGARDSLAAFQAALAAAAANGTNTVWVPPGNYTVAGHVEFVDGDDADS